MPRALCIRAALAECDIERPAHAQVVVKSVCLRLNRRVAEDPPRELVVLALRPDEHHAEVAVARLLHALFEPRLPRLRVGELRVYLLWSVVRKVDEVALHLPRRVHRLAAVLHHHLRRGQRGARRVGAARVAGMHA